MIFTCLLIYMIKNMFYKKQRTHLIAKARFCFLPQFLVKSQITKIRIASGMRHTSCFGYVTSIATAISTRTTSKTIPSALKMLCLKRHTKATSPTTVPRQMITPKIVAIKSIIFFPPNDTFCLSRLSQAEDLGTNNLKLLILYHFSVQITIFS